METQHRFTSQRSIRTDSNDIGRRNPYGSPTASVRERTKIINQRQNFSSPAGDLFAELSFRPPSSFSPAELYSDSSFDIDPLDELDALADALDDEEWGHDCDDYYGNLPERSSESDQCLPRNAEAAVLAPALLSRSPGSNTRTEKKIPQHDDGILWPFMRPTGEILYEKVVFCLFMIVFIVKETLFAMVAYADMLLCTLILNTGLFILHRLWLCRDRSFINPLRLLNRRDRSQAIFKVVAAAIYVWIGIMLLAGNNDSHSKKPSLPSHDLEAIRAAVQYVLPNYVPLNPDTGKVDLTSAISDEYVRRSELPVNLSKLISSTTSVPTWQEFMGKNGRALESFVQKAVGESWQQFLNENSQALENFVRISVEKYVAKKGYIQYKYDPTAPEDSHPPTAACIADALQTYHQDMLGIPDFALATRGGRIIRRLTSETYDPRPLWKTYITSILGGSRTLQHSPLIALLPETHIGQCWPMAGATGTLGVMLSEPVVVKAITVEYPSRQMEVNMTSAPKDIEVWGLPRDGYKETTDQKSLVFLGSFTYDISKNVPVQTFLVQPENPAIIKSVLFKFNSNWGLDTYTCIYRIRVHGDAV